MRQLRRIIIGTLVGLICTFIFSGVAAPAQAAAGLTVNCSSTDYASIQLAVNAAAPNATIKVCPYYGAFSEQVIINNKTGLKLIGMYSPIITPPVDDWGLTTGEDPVMIEVNNSTNVTVSGFVVDGNWNLYGTPHMVGIGFYNSSGTITKNVIVRIKEDSLGSLGEGVGIEIANDYGTAPAKVSVTKNTISDFQHFGIGVYENVIPTITSNRIMYSGVGGASPIGINMSNLPGQSGPPKIAGGTISKNVITCDWSFNSSNGCTGIDLKDSDYVTISSNKISGNSTGIYAWTDGERWPSVRYGNFTKNEITDAYDGIVLYAEGTYRNVVVDFNKIQSNKITSFNMYPNSAVLLDYDEPSSYSAEVELNTVTKNTFSGFLSGWIVDNSNWHTNTITPNKWSAPPAGAAAPPHTPQGAPQPPAQSKPAHGTQTRRGK